MSFRNGVLKNNPPEKNFLSSPPPHSNIIKATRSPYQSQTNSDATKASSSPKNEHSTEANEKSN